MRGCRLGSGHYITQAVELISANDDTRAARDGGEKKKTSSELKIDCCELVAWKTEDENLAE